MGSPLSARLSHLQLHFRELRAFDWVRFLLIVFISFSTSLVSFFSVLLMAPRREIAAFRAQGKHPIEPLSLIKRRLTERRGMTRLSSVP